MKLKKLGFMNVKRENILSRNEMKNTIAGSGNTICGGGICAGWAVCCTCPNGTFHGCQPQNICDIYCMF